MKFFFVSVFALLLSTYVLAGTEKPVSVSYQNVIRCFPELNDPRNSAKVDLNLLKDLIDKKFVTSNSSLRYRQVDFKDNAGQMKRLTLARVGQGKTYKLSFQKVDDKGSTFELPLSQAQRINPKNSEIASLMLNGTILIDEYAFDDSKLNGVTLSYRRQFQDIQQLLLSGKNLKKSISCDTQKGLGVICTCALK